MTLEEQMELLRSQNAALLQHAARLAERVAELEGLAQQHGGGPPATSEHHQEVPQVQNYQQFLDLITVQPPQPPLLLPVVTLEQCREVCEGLNVGFLLYRLTEVPEGMTVPQALASIGLDALWEVDNLAMGLTYVSTAMLENLQAPSLAAMKPTLMKMWSTNSAFRNEWQGTLRNLLAGRLHATVQRGVIYQTASSQSLFNVMTTYILAEWEPSTGKMHLALGRRAEILQACDPRIRSTAMHHLMALKYSPNMLVLVCPDTGQITWQNSASCAMMGALASDNAYPVRGSCEPYAFDYLSELFFGSEHLRKEMEQKARAGLVFRCRVQIKGPKLRQLMGVTTPRREVWHNVQCSMLRDPTSQEMVYIMAQHDITEIVLAERRVKQLQKQQLSLLKEMLPQQVIDALLSQEPSGGGLSSSMTDTAFHDAAAAAAAAGVASDDSWVPSGPLTPSLCENGSPVPGRSSTPGAAPTASSVAAQAFGALVTEEVTDAPPSPTAAERDDAAGGAVTLSPSRRHGEVHGEAYSQGKVPVVPSGNRCVPPDSAQGAMHALAGSGPLHAHRLRRPWDNLSAQEGPGRGRMMSLDLSRAGREAAEGHAQTEDFRAALWNPADPAWPPPRVPSGAGGAPVPAPKALEEPQPAEAPDSAGRPDLRGTRGAAGSLGEVGSPSQEEALERDVFSVSKKLHTFQARVAACLTASMSHGGGPATFSSRKHLPPPRAPGKRGMGLSDAVQQAIDNCPIMGEYCMWTKSDRVKRELNRRVVQQRSIRVRSEQPQDPFPDLDEVLVPQLHQAQARGSQAGRELSEVQGSAQQHLAPIAAAADPSGLEEAGGKQQETASEPAGLDQAGDGQRSAPEPFGLDQARDLQDAAQIHSDMGWASGGECCVPETTDLDKAGGRLCFVPESSGLDQAGGRLCCVPESCGLDESGDRQCSALEQDQAGHGGRSAPEPAGLGQGRDGQYVPVYTAQTPPEEGAAEAAAQDHRQQQASAEEGEAGTGAVSMDLPSVASLPSSLSNVRSISRDGSGLQLSRRDVMSLATWHEEVSILFTDLKGFTSMSSSLHPAQIMLFLNHLYSLFDDLVGQYDVYKVETIGDSYMVAGGLFDRSEQLVVGEHGPGLMMTDASTSEGDPALRPSPTDILVGAEASGDRTSGGSMQGARPHAGTEASKSNLLGGRDPDHARKVLAFAKAMVATAANVIDPLGNRVQMRVGIHSGSVMSGVVGRKCPRFCLFGDTVNTASRMESTGEPGCIHVSQAFRDLVPEEPWEHREVFAKGKGTLTTFMMELEAPLPTSDDGE